MIWFEITVIISDLHDILSSRELCTYVSDIGLKITRSFYLDLPVDLQFFFTVSCIKVNLSRFWVMLDIIMGNGESRRKLRETRQERKCINLCCTTSIIIRIILNSTSGRILRKEMQKDPQGTWRYGGNSHGIWRSYRGLRLINEHFYSQDPSLYTPFHLHNSRRGSHGGKFFAHDTSTPFVHTHHF